VSTTSPSEFMGMDQFVHLEYHDQLSPTVRRYAEFLREGKRVGQQCPICHLVYVPPKGYCPIDTIVLGPDEEIELEDHGVITAYTIVTPVQYHGQQETEPFVRATVLLDGPGGILGLQDIPDVPHDEVRTGMRVEAIWLPKDKRSTKGLDNRAWGSTAGCITGWRPTGEPDVDPEQFKDKVF
jgi:uncharacterized OB-fold protein